LLTFLSTRYFKAIKAVLIVLVFTLAHTAFALRLFEQNESGTYRNQTVEIQPNIPDTIIGNKSQRNDTLIVQSSKISDSLTSDSASMPKKTSALADIVDYNSSDSLRFDIKNHKVFMFKKGVLNYEKINLTGDYVEIDFDKSEIFSKGIENQDGKISGTPVFKEGDKSFESKELRYNFDTKKGIIFGVKTTEGDGFLLSEKVKKMADDVTYIQGGQYTTCQLDEPHYSFRFKKSKVIPGDMIITGPVVFEIEGVPTPLMLPFGLFPNKSGKRSGILMPTYGETAKQGYYLSNGGYYWALSDYFDLTLRGSVYTRGSWSLNPSVRYVKKYKYTGSLNFKYAINILGTEGSPDYSRNKDFSIQWTHKQDDKARPNSRFSSNVDIVTNTFNQFETQNTFESKLSNSFQSSINYSTNFNKKWYLNLNVSQGQNTRTKSFDITVPKISLAGPQIYPFRKKNKVGNLKWYENISVKYNFDAKNAGAMPDSMLFKPGMYDFFKNGVKHDIPISSTIKLFKYFSWNNSASFTERWYSQSIAKSFVFNDVDVDGNPIGSVVTEKLNGLKAVHEYSLSSGITTRAYVMYQFGNKLPIRAIRHVVNPTVSFNYRPDYSEDKYGYYDSYFDEINNKYVLYSVFEGAIYGSPASGKSGSVNFNVSNNFEMKVRDRNDTITGTKKLVLIDNLSLSTNYNMAKDSLRWAPLSLDARTRLFKNLDIRYSAQFDPYILDSAGTNNLNQFEWTVNKRILRFQNASYAVGFNFRLDNETFRPKEVGNTDEGTKKERAIKPIMPWSISVNYSFLYTNNHSYLNYVLQKDQKTIQTLGFNGNVQLSPTWKISVRSGYDFATKQLSYTSMEIYRDLHCWEMHFSWIPLGTWKSWNFGINIKSSMLKDLKLEKKKSHLDY
jgi:hypothetical protein